MCKNQFSYDKQKELAKILNEEITKYFGDLEQDVNDVINLNRVVIDKNLLQIMIRILLSDYSEILKYIDLTGISFSGLDVSYKNLEGTNADIDPQTVYKKSLENTKLKNLDMSEKDFTYVDVRKADLEGTYANIDYKQLKCVGTESSPVENTKLKGCIVFNYGDSSDPELREEGIILVDDIYDDAKKYIKSLFN